ncbi:uncharacterized protein LOC117132701 [Brassica rapa]|uniref:uncharacterized protein LOC117132701 n=1 Tax=Brassica campestris TaxID=3711 RepID=UPI00142E60E6|nr:uncharacterized protein LOC117132701 [Brassica rapa]
MANEGENHGAAQPMNVLGVLNPSRVNGSLWFKRDSVITSEIRTIIRSDFPGPYRNWSTTPKHVKERWWFTFKKEKNGDASYIDVLRETQKKSDGSFVDERARLISEGFEKNVADHMLEDDILVTEELTSEKKNQMYLKLVDSTQGRVFGLGALLSEVSLNAKMPVTIETHLESDEFKKKVEDISQENEDIKERLSKLEGLEKMIAILCPAILSRGVNNNQV